MDEMENEMVEHLMALSNSKPNQGFQGFDAPTTSTVTPMEEDSREKEVVTPVSAETVTTVPKPDLTMSQKSKNSHLMESDVKMVVEQVVTQLSPIIRTFCVTDRMLQIQQESDDWKSLVALLMKNPKCVVANWDPKKQHDFNAPDIRKSIERSIAFPHPCEQTWEQFMASPLSTPVWTVITKLDLTPTSEVFTKWWKKIKTDNRIDAWKKLARYLQCIRYFNLTSDEFWAQLSVNPTYWSIQKISVNLAAQANWIKASGLELKELQAKYLEVASQIVQGEPTVRNVMEILAGLWPANFRPIKLHYDGEPFIDTVLYAQDSSTLCVKTAKPKGLKVSDSLFGELNDSVNDASAVPVEDLVSYLT